MSNLWSFALKKISHADTADLRGNLSHGVFAAHKIHKRHKSAHVTLVLASGVEISSKLHASGELKFSSAQPTPNREQNQAMLNYAEMRTDERARVEAKFTLIMPSKEEETKVVRRKTIS